MEYFASYGCLVGKYFANLPTLPTYLPGLVRSPNTKPAAAGSQAAGRIPSVHLIRTTLGNKPLAQEKRAMAIRDVQYTKVRGTAIAA
jgi:hypothetical protein